MLWRNKLASVIFFRIIELAFRTHYTLQRDSKIACLTAVLGPVFRKDLCSSLYVHSSIPPRTLLSAMHTPLPTAWYMSSCLPFHFMFLFLNAQSLPINHARATQPITLMTDCTCAFLFFCYLSNLTSFSLFGFNHFCN